MPKASMRYSMSTGASCACNVGQTVGLDAVMSAVCGGCVAAVLNVSELFGDPATRRRAGKAHEFTSQMGLIAVSGACGHSGEINGRATPYRVRDRPRGPLESHQHRDRFR